MLSAANENEATCRRAGEARPLSGPERTALAMLRCGRSFAEAAESSGVSAATLFRLWRDETAH